MVTTRPPKTIVKPTALGPVANTDTKLLIYGLFQKGRVLAQDGGQHERRYFRHPESQPKTQGSLVVRETKLPPTKRSFEDSRKKSIQR